jgi:ribonuclease HII
MAAKIDLRKRTQKLIRYDNKMRKLFGNYICGVDEAGRGPLAGPVVAAAVVFEAGVYIKGVFDSKQLLYEQRAELFDTIKNKCITFGIGIVMHDEIDRINILNATKDAMTKAVDALDIAPSVILADGNFYKHEATPVVNVIKGDGLSFAIAAASIIAKVTRDRLMEKYENLYPNFTFSKHKGYCTKKHIDEIKLFGYSNIHRQSFRVKKLEERELFEMAEN